MAELETLKEADLKQVLNNKSLRKARGYLGRVSNATRSGPTLRADVRGTSLYTVEIDVIDSSIHAICSCPYDWGGYCKHIGAVLLKWIESPRSFVAEAAATASPSGFPIETFPVDPPPATIPKEKPPWLRLPYADRRRQDEQQLSNWLGQYKVQELRQMAKQRGWQISGTRKDDIVGQIMAQMLQPGIAAKGIMSLDTEHRQVWQAMALLSPALPFKDDHLEIVATRWGPLQQYKKITTYTGHLCEAGLAIPGAFTYQYWQPADFVPNTLMRVLPPPLAGRITETELPDHSHSQLRLADPLSFVRTANQIMLFLEQSTPPLRQPMPRPRLEKFYEFLRAWDYVPEEVQQAHKNNKLKEYDLQFSLAVPPPRHPLPDEVVARLAPIAGDAGKLAFYYHLLVTAGLLQPGSPVTAWREAKEHFLRRSEADQWAILARTYFAVTTWSELWLALAERADVQLRRGKGSYYGYLQPAQMGEKLGQFRHQVLRVLACLPDARWFSLRALCDVLHPIWPRFDHWAWSQTAYGGNMKPPWFLAQNGRFLDTANNKADWNIAQGNFIRQVLLGPLHWLGLADLSFEHGRLVAFRLQGLADLFWDRTGAIPLPGGQVAKEEAVALAEAVSVAGTLITVDPVAISAQAHNYLDSLAILDEAATNRFVYRLYAPAVHAAFEEGHTLAQLLDGWQKWLPIPLPDAIHRQLEAWWQAYGQVRLYENVTVVEFGDEYALAEMKAATSLEKHLIAEISPQLVLIPENTVDILLAELEKAGYTPKQTDKVT